MTRERRVDEQRPGDAEALYRAARPPVEQLWFDADHQALPGVALKAMWEFLTPSLDLKPA